MGHNTGKQQNSSKKNSNINHPSLKNKRFFLLPPCTGPLDGKMENTAYGGPTVPLMSKEQMFLNQRFAQPKKKKSKTTKVNDPIQHQSSQNYLSFFFHLLTTKKQQPLTFFIKNRIGVRPSLRDFSTATMGKQETNGTTSDDVTASRIKSQNISSQIVSSKIVLFYLRSPSFNSGTNVLNSITPVLRAP